MVEKKVNMGDLFCSQMNTIDVLVIGAGPIGLIAALWFGKRSYRTVLIEQYAENKTSGKRRSMNDINKWD